ncbi:nucleolar transcription factor 1-like [Trichogramma pretiosum]|uniref:nucleolar transcription factor 1-like n=1 Tax=Trichogramma pretiosum TaxID=7493 RepID=UPI0006C9903E|nr:nucleolar transcription factor 1-like [Trichogramma pretiosum]
MSDSESSEIREFDYSNVTSDREIGDSRRSELDESYEISDDKAAVANSLVEAEELEEGDEGFPAEDDRGDDDDDDDDDENEAEEELGRMSKDELAALVDRSLLESGEGSDDSDWEPPYDETEESFDYGAESNDGEHSSDFERSDDDDDNDVTSENFASGHPSECDEYGESSDYDDSRNNSVID